VKIARNAAPVAVRTGHVVRAAMGLARAGDRTVIVVRKAIGAVRAAMVIVRNVRVTATLVVRVGMIVVRNNAANHSRRCQILLSL